MKKLVAPYAGAWIEIFCVLPENFLAWSLPTRERGLKYHDKLYTHTRDWSLPTRERGLKWTVAFSNRCQQRRSLRGSVD